MKMNELNWEGLGVSTAPWSVNVIVTKMNYNIVSSPLLIITSSHYAIKSTLDDELILMQGYCR